MLGAVGLTVAEGVEAILQRGHVAARGTRQDHPHRTTEFTHDRLAGGRVGEV